MTRPQLHFLGTGTAFHHDGRGSQCILVRPESAAPFLVDLGPTSMAAVMRYGVATDDIDQLFVTHLHGDHMAGWPFLLLHLRFVDGRERPLLAHGPVGLRARLEGLMQLSYPDVLEGPQLGFEVHYHELAVTRQTGCAAGGVAYAVLPMDHHPSSIAYRFEVDGRRLGVTGDTRWCDNLEALAGDCDLLLVECTSLEPHGHAHLSLREIREQASRLGSCDVVLVHLPDEVAAALAFDPIPRVTTSYDGMLLDF